MRTIHRRHRDRQRAYPAGECGLCGAELYPGELCWLLCGARLCRSCAAVRLRLAPRSAGGREVAP